MDDIALTVKRPFTDAQKDKKMRQAGTVRCPHCFYLLKIPTEVSQAQKLTSLIKPRIKQKTAPTEPEISQVEKINFKDLDSDELFNSCPVCNLIFEEEQSLVRCSNCKTLYHEHCFKDLRNNRCKNCGVKLHLY